MKFTKYGLLALLVVSLSSCLKSVNDFGGMRTDKGGIVTSIVEAQYLNADAQNLGLHYSVFANFSFSTPNEEVRFFNLHISQPRETKMSGSMVAKVTAAAVPGYTALPAGALTITDVTIPASSAAAFDVPVKFAVNKAVLNPANHYAVRFTISSISQGVVSDLDKTIDVVINGGTAYNTSRYSGLYKWTCTLTDPANQYGLTLNTKAVELEENAANSLDIMDHQLLGFTGSAATASRVLVYNLANMTANGAPVALFAPRYVLNASGKVTGVINQSATASITNLVMDASAPNQFNYTANDNRTMEIKYSFTLTTTINGVSTARTVVVSEKYEYEKTQAYYEQ
jgi:hypothetical protein